MPDPPTVDDVIDRWCRDGVAASASWTDFYLAAYAVAGALRLVTFDRDFARFKGLDLLHLAR